MATRKEHKGAAVATTIVSDITSSATSIVITTATGWPTGATGPFFVTLGRGTASEERVEVLSRSSTTLTLASSGKRGVDNTTAASHTAGTAIEHTLAAQELDESSAHITDTTADDHTQYMKTDGTRHDLTARHSVGTVIPAASAGAIAAVSTAASAGVATTVARGDHVHTIAAGTVDATALASSAVTAAKIASDAVTTVKILDANVTAAKLASDAVTTVKILDANVTAAKLASDSVTTVKILDANVTAAKLAGSITQDKLSAVSCCRVYNSALISVADDSAAHGLTFNTERYDTDTMHSTSSLTGRITFTTAGVYSFGASIEWAASATGRRLMNILMNGTDIIGSTEDSPGTAVVWRQFVSGTWKFAAADYIEVQVLQNSGGSLNVNASGNYSPEFWATRHSA